MPDLCDVELEGQERRAKVVLGRFYVGEKRLAHGGAVMVLFDDFRAGCSTTWACRPAVRRTSRPTSGRSHAGRRGAVAGRLIVLKGAKRFVTGELRHGDTVCGGG
ncbi:MAG: hypothetical protein R2709_14290 [Marmoricola sp.]